MQKLKKRKIGTKKFSKLGHEARWRERYNALVELSKKYSYSEYKKHQFNKWKTAHLLELIKWINKIK